jgi:hypothetical protein
MKAILTFTLVWGLAVAGIAQSGPPATDQSPVPCPRCGWQPPAATRTVVVQTVGELERAVATAREGDEILLADGRYSLQRTIEIGVPHVTLRGRSGDATRVILHGRGLRGDTVGVAVGAGASGVTVADMTIRSVGYHAVQVRGENGASDFTLHGAVLEDAGQQLLKGSLGTNGRVSSNGLVACSEFRYTTSAPSDYTNGVDILGTRQWVIRDNRFFKIQGPQRSAGPSILVWQGAEDTVVERNVIVDSFRGIALGLQPSMGGKGYDHLRGIVRQNIVLNLNPWADEAIEANGARGARIEHNTVLVNGSVDWSIGVRFPSASAEIRNNLTTGRILSRDGGVIAVDRGNVSGARPDWFEDAGRLNFRLTRLGGRAVDAGLPISEITEDFLKAPRVNGKAPDAGAIEAAPSR